MWDPNQLHKAIASSNNLRCKIIDFEIAQESRVERLRVNIKEIELALEKIEEESRRDALLNGERNEDRDLRWDIDSDTGSNGQNGIQNEADNGTCLPSLMFYLL